MERNIKSLIGFTMGATDGEIGKVAAFYFDDESWAIRFLVVKTGSWLFGRTVLISPVALKEPAWENREFPVNLTKDQVSNSPDINTQQPVSRLHEMALYEHYAWQPYQASGFYSGGQWGIMPPAPLFDERISENSGPAEIQKENDDEHLRSTERITGYHIHSTDGEIGHVNDFIIDDETLQIIYFVVNTHNWIGGKKVLIPVSDVKEMKWEDSTVIVDLTKDAVNNLKVFDETVFRRM